MVHQHLAVLVLPQRDVLNRGLVVGQGAVGFVVLAIEVLSDSEGDPVTSQARLGTQDRLARENIGAKLAEMDGEDGEVGEDVGRVLG